MRNPRAYDFDHWPKRLNHWPQRLNFRILRPPVAELSALLPHIDNVFMHYDTCLFYLIHWKLFKTFLKLDSRKGDICFCPARIKVVENIAGLKMVKSHLSMKKESISQWKFVTYYREIWYYIIDVITNAMYTSNANQFANVIFS